MPPVSTFDQLRASVAGLTGPISALRSSIAGPLLSVETALIVWQKENPGDPRGPALFGKYQSFRSAFIGMGTMQFDLSMSLERLSATSSSREL